MTEATLAALGTTADKYLTRSLGHVTLRGVDKPMELFDIVTGPGREFPIEEEETAVEAEPTDMSPVVEVTPSTPLKNPDSKPHPAQARRYMMAAPTSSSDGDSLDDDDTGGWVQFSQLVLSTALSACDQHDRLETLHMLQRRWRTAKFAAADDNEEPSLLSALARGRGTWSWREADTDISPLCHTFPVSR